MVRIKAPAKDFRTDLQELKSDAERLMREVTVLRERCADLEDRTYEDSTKPAKSRL
jgi:hypothetical protein